MGISFDWDEPQTEEPNPDKPPIPGSRRRGRFVLLLIVSSILLVAAAYTVFRLWLQPDRDELTAAVRLQLEAEASAVSLGNHDLFLTLHDSDPAWLAARYRQLPSERGRGWTVEEVRPVGDHVHALLGWREDGERYRMPAFFLRHEGRLIRTASDPGFWGEAQTRTTGWGTLVYHVPDAAWLDAIESSVAQAVGDACNQGCINTSLPLTLYLAPDERPIHAGASLSFPSPQLLGITQEGDFSPEFLPRLEETVRRSLLPATVRFGVPDSLMEQADATARAFMDENSSISVELIPLSLLSPEPIELLRQVDAAMIPPTRALITAGEIVDLTDYAQATARFDYEELYAFAQAGSHWQERVWSVPQYAEYRVLYSDRASFAAAVMSPEEYQRVLWSAADNKEGVEENATDRTTNRRWLLMDVSRHSLFAYAYDYRCLQSDERRCDDALTDADLAATLAWYQERLNMGIMPDVTSMTDDQRRFFAFNQLGYPRKVTLWFDNLGVYEHNTQLGPLDVAAAAGIDGAGITPFQTVGAVMSARTADPAATWQWLAFLSTWRPMGTARSMPVRDSTAEEIGYWTNLPAPLQPVVRTAFARGRGVSIEENGYFDWALVNDVVVGRITLKEGAAIMTDPAWFGGQTERQ